MGSVEDELSAALGVDVRLAWATEALSPATLTAGEAAQWHARRSEGSRHDWLLGRAALRALLPDGHDTSALAFPHHALSVSHAGGVAVAVRGDGDLRGVGVDFEPHRVDVDQRIVGFFLSVAEQAAAVDTAALLRLWTVKEALYKATPDNASCLLLDYALADPRAAYGDAVGPAAKPCATPASTWRAAAWPSPSAR